eukprot:TRINITY_DN3998_c0_g4_i1.p1 TRINITY_DN3998_c0_g4~~TRINITY_DN3998_c0_g4_i1.p1  ORF type:complete len:1376 (+),score=509.89 TRINITY_DN3998_c0_g4_i1:510-4637(+)
MPEAEPSHTPSSPRTDTSSSARSPSYSSSASSASSASPSSSHVDKDNQTHSQTPARHPPPLPAEPSPLNAKPPLKSLFNEHDNDWPTVDLGNLITDLDADINNSSATSSLSAHHSPSRTHSSSSTQNNKQKMSTSNKAPHNNNNNNTNHTPNSASTSSAHNTAPANTTSSLLSNPPKILPLLPKAPSTALVASGTPSSGTNTTSTTHNNTSAQSSMTTSANNAPSSSSSSSASNEPRAFMDGGSNNNGTGNEKGLKMKIKRNKTTLSHSSSAGSPLGKPENAEASEEIHASPPPSTASSATMNTTQPMSVGLSHEESNAPIASQAPFCSKLLSKPPGNKQNGEVLDSPPTTNAQALSQATNNCSSNSSTSNGSGPSAMSVDPCNFIKMDASVGTEIGTMTEPDCLGPLDPGTSVTLEGIVWHETEGGVLVINVTWRGKTYVGTLLDSTQHVNQYSESPNAEIDNKKGRGNKRAGRPGSEPELTRKNLRSSKGKPLKNSAAANSNSPSKRKKGLKDEDSNDSSSSSLKRQRTSSKNNSADENEDDSEKESSSSKDGGDGSSSNNPPSSAPLINPSSSSASNTSSAPLSGSAGLPAATPLAASKEAAPPEEEVEMTPKDPKEVKYIPPPPLPYALSCPSPGCKKRYRQHNGLRFHISHSHKELLDSKGDIRDTSDIDKCEKEAKQRLRKRGILLDGEGGGGAEGDEKKHHLLPSEEAPLMNGSGEAAAGAPNKEPPEKEEDQQHKSNGTEGKSLDLSSSPMETTTTATEEEDPTKECGGSVPNNGGSANNASDAQESQNGVEKSNGAAPATDNGHAATTNNSTNASSMAKSPAYSDISDDVGDDEAKLKELKAKSSSSSTLTNTTTTCKPTSNEQNNNSTSISGSGGSSCNSSSAPANTTTTTSSSNSALSPVPSSPSLSSNNHNHHNHHHHHHPLSTPPSSSSSLVPPPAAPPPTSSSNNHFPFAPYIPSTASNAVLNNTTPPSSSPASSFKPEPIKATAASDYQKMFQAYVFPSFPPFPDPGSLMMGEPGGLKVKEKAMKEQLEAKERRRSSLGITPPPPSNKAPEDLRKPSPRSMMISVKPEFNVPKSEPGRKTPLGKDEGSKPTMETRGPPPASINPYHQYLHHSSSLLRPPGPGVGGLSYEALAAAAGSINPLLLSPNPYMPNPYLPPHPGMRPPYAGGPEHRQPYNPPQGPEDLSRSVSLGPPSGGSNPPHNSGSGNSSSSTSGVIPPQGGSSSATKALDLLQQHASSYYANSHKIHELSDHRSLKSSEKGGSKDSSRKRTPSPASPSPAAPGLIRSRSPPPLRHVHTHTHTHFGLGYPLLHPPGGVPPPPPSAHTPFNPGAYPSHLLPPSGSKGSLPGGPLGTGFPPPPK